MEKTPHSKIIKMSCSKQKTFHSGKKKGLETHSNTYKLTTCSTVTANQVEQCQLCPGATIRRMKRLSMRSFKTLKYNRIVPLQTNTFITQQIHGRTTC